MGSSFDVAKISQSGNYIVTDHGNNGGGEFAGINVYSRNLTNRRHLTNNSRHGDVGVDSTGNDVWVQYFGNGLNSSVTLWRLSNGAVTNLLPHANSQPEPRPGVWGGHLSCRNLNRPGWCYLSDGGYDYDSQYWVGNDEIIALKLDGSGTVERFAHMHHSYNAGYEHERFGSPDRDGRRVIFRSDWGGGSSAEVNSYVAYNTSLVPDGGFEFGAAGWNPFSGSQWQIETTDTYSGSASLRVITQGGSSPFATEDVTPGKKYRLAAVAKATNGDYTTGVVCVQFYDNNPNYNQLSQECFTVTTGYYNYYQVLANAPSGSTRVRAVVYKDNGPGDMLVDQLILSEF